jgi:hypothetical protein
VIPPSDKCKYIGKIHLLRNHPIAGNSLEQLLPPTYRKILGTRANNPGHGNNVIDWTIRSEAPKMETLWRTFRGRMVIGVVYITMLKLWPLPVEIQNSCRDIYLSRNELLTCRYCMSTGKRTAHKRSRSTYEKHTGAHKNIKKKRNTNFFFVYLFLQSVNFAYNLFSCFINMISRLT